MVDLHREWSDFKYNSQFGKIPPPIGMVPPVSSGTDVALSTTEAVIATLTTKCYSGQKVLLMGWSQLDTAAVSTNPVLSIRRTGLAGVVLGEANALTLAASSSGEGNIMLVDTVPADDQVYVLTGKTTTGTGTAKQFALVMLPVG